MSEILQPGLHLDPDTLSAFAEDALPAHERDAALAHLAVCARCRQLVQLAQPEMEELQPGAVVVPSRGSFAGWRWIFGGAAACAGLGLATVALLNQPQRQAAPAAVARVEAPPTPVAAQPAPQQDRMAKVPAVQPKVALAPTPPRPAGQLAMKPTVPAAVLPPAAAAAPPFMAEAKPSSAGASPLGQIHGSAEPMPTLRSQSADRSSMSYLAPAPGAPKAVAVSPVARAAAQPAPLPPAPPPVVVAGAGSAARASSGSTMEVYAAPPMFDTANGSLQQLLPELPSRLAAASRYADGARVVAVDTAGVVFFSKDAGQHWSPAKAAWSGRVVRVGAPGMPAAPAPAKALAAPLIDDAHAGTASVQGSVDDASGAVIPGASVTLIGNGVNLHVLADRAGRYRLHGLAAGAYQLRAEYPGFATTQQAFTLTAGQRAASNVTLQAGAMSEAVTVTSDIPQVALKKRKTPVFALETSTGERWESADGKNWQRQ